MFGSLSYSIEDASPQQSEVNHCRRPRRPIPDLSAPWLTLGIAARVLPYNPTKTLTNFWYGASQMLNQQPATEDWQFRCHPPLRDRPIECPGIEQMVTAR